MNALKKMKRGKAAGMNGIAVEMLKYGGVSLVNWLRIFNRCMELRVVSENWKITCTIPLYRSDCGNYRRISLFGIPGRCMVGC